MGRYRGTPVSPTPLRAWRDQMPGARRLRWIARGLGVAEAEVSRWDSGVRVPGPAWRERIETATGGAVRADAWLTEDDGEDEPQGPQGAA